MINPLFHHRLPLLPEVKEQKPITLSDVNMEIVRLMSEGLSIKQISGITKMSEHGIEHSRIRLYKKLKVKNGCELIAFAFRNKILK
jgi:DNA-binding NarL/FixJ family response regulator